MAGLPLKPRKLASGGLTVVARTMQLGAFMARTLAERLAQDGTPPRGDEGPGPVRTAEARLRPPEAADLRAGRVSQPPVDAVPMVDEHVRTYETHAGELAGRSAGDVIDRVPELSTDELRALYEHEQANKRRKTVLQAIERQLAPA